MNNQKTHKIQYKSVPYRSWFPVAPEIIPQIDFQYDPNWCYKRLINQLYCQDYGAYDLQALEIFNHDQDIGDKVDRIIALHYEINHGRIEKIGDYDDGNTTEDHKEDADLIKDDNYNVSSDGVSTPSGIDSPHIYTCPHHKTPKAYSEGYAVSPFEKVYAISFPLDKQRVLENQSKSNPASPISKEKNVASPFHFLYNFNSTEELDFNNDIVHVVLNILRKSMGSSFFIHTHRNEKYVDGPMISRIISEFESVLNDRVYCTLQLEIWKFCGNLVFNKLDFYPKLFDQILRNIGVDVEYLLEKPRIFHPNINSIIERDLENYNILTEVSEKDYVAVSYEKYKMSHLFQEVWHEWCLGYYGQVPIWKIESNRYQIYKELNGFVKDDDEFQFRCPRRFKVIRFIIYGMVNFGFRAQTLIDLLQSYYYFNNDFGFDWILSCLGRDSNMIIDRVYHVDLLNGLSIEKMFDYHDFYG